MGCGLGDSQVLGDSFLWEGLLWALLPSALPLCALQISPQIYRSLGFMELSPVQPPAALIHKVLDQQGRHIRWAAHGAESARDQVLPDASLSVPAASSCSSSLSLAASVEDALLDPSFPLRPHSSTSLPRSGSTASLSAPPEAPQSALQRPEATTAVASSLQQPPKPPEAPLMASTRRRSRVSF